MSQTFEIFNPDSADDERENMTELFNTNVAATHLVTRAFLPLLHRSDKKVVINM